MRHQRPRGRHSCTSCSSLSSRIPVCGSARSGSSATSPTGPGYGFGARHHEPLCIQLDRAGRSARWRRSFSRPGFPASGARAGAECCSMAMLAARSTAAAAAVGGHGDCSIQPRDPHSSSTGRWPTGSTNSAKAFGGVKRGPCHVGAKRAFSQGWGPLLRGRRFEHAPIRWPARFQADLPQQGRQEKRRAIGPPLQRVLHPGEALLDSLQRGRLEHLLAAAAQPAQLHDAREVKAGARLGGP